MQEDVSDLQFARDFPFSDLLAINVSQCVPNVELSTNIGRASLVKKKIVS